MTSAATVRTSRSPATWSVVSPTGDLDIAALPDLRGLLHPHLVDPSRDVVVVDLTHVTFMDCSALGILMGARARLGGRLWLRGVPPSVAWLLQLTGLQDVFGRFDEPLLALRSVDA